MPNVLTAAYISPARLPPPASPLSHFQDGRQSYILRPNRLRSRELLCSLLFSSFHHLINSIYQPFLMATPTPPPPRERRPSTGAPISDLRGPVGPPGFTRPKHKRTLTGFGAGEIKSVEGELFPHFPPLVSLSTINSHHFPPSQLPSPRTSALPGRNTARNPSRPPRTSRRKSCAMSRRRSRVACSTAMRRPRMPLPVWRSETA